MATVKLKITPEVAAFVAPGVTSDVKKRGVTAAAGMNSLNRIMLLFCLTHDSDLLVKSAATSAFSVLPIEALVEYAGSPEAHPSILDFIARLHFKDPLIVAALLKNLSLSPAAREFLETYESKKVQEHEEEQTADGTDATDATDATDDVGEMSEADTAVVDTLPDEEEEEEEQPTEEFYSKYQLAQLMGIGEKIKMALTGDKEWRAILIKDANKLVSGSVIKNPRITDGEVLTILKVGVQNDEIIRLICANKEWVKNYKIRKALVENPKTPLPSALRYLASMGEKDIAGYAKSKNISSVLSTQAKRILLSKKR